MFQTAVAWAAAPIPTLYNTGVDGAGVVLPGLSDDPHYAIVVSPIGIMPDMVVPPDGFPVPPWFPNNPGSSWIGPLDLGPGNDANGPPGDYLYETNIDLTGFDPTNWFVSGAWGSDDPGPSILVNGSNVVGVLGVNVANAPSGGFGGPTLFTLSPSVVASAGGAVGAGPNSLIFHVNNGGGPTGLRVDGMYSRAAPAGSVKIPGLHNTGVDAADLPLPTGVDDPHYALVAPGTIVPDQTAVTNDVFPIGPWYRNTATSRWITPPDPSGNGDPTFFYFETTFDLTGLDPATAAITGLWSSDNVGHDVLLNGVATGNPQLGSFPLLSTFEISAALGDAFNPGLNTLTFVVENLPPGINPMGLRVEGIVAHANVVPEPSAILMLAVGGLGLLVAGRRRRSR
jgi:hypothetical protein